jgi:hypothetical protein
MNRRWGIWIGIATVVALVITVVVWPPARTPDAATVTPMNPPLLTEVPGKPGWRQTAHLDWKLTDDERTAERGRIAATFDLKTHHVVLGLDLAGDSTPPSGYPEAQHQRFLEGAMKHGSKEEALASISMIDFNHYQGIRVFVIPRSDTADLIRSFRVGSHSDDRPEHIESVAQRVVAVNEVVPVTIPDAWPAWATLVFLEPASEADCRALEELFPLTAAGLDGLEIYYNDWEPSWGEKFLADWFHREQKISLWWD